MLTPNQQAIAEPHANNQNNEITETNFDENLITLQRELRTKTAANEFGFFVVNETRKSITYDTAFFFQLRLSGRCHITNISGIPQIDRNIPIIQFLEHILNEAANEPHQENCILLKKEQYPQSVQDKWDPALGDSLLYCPFYNDEGKLLGGLLFAREMPWDKQQLQNLGELIDAYQYSWQHLSSKVKIIQSHHLGFFARRKKSTLIAMLVVFLGICLFPVRLTVLAPAEVVPKDADIITAPQEGVIKKILVKPNETVQKGQILFSLDKTDIRNAHALAVKQLDVAKAKLKQAVQLGFQSIEERAQVPVLRAEIAEHQLEANYTETLLKKADVRAPKAGIVVFSGKEDWEGKPIATGEKVMKLTEAKQNQIEIWLPIADNMNIPEHAPIKLYLNSDPLNAITGEVSYASYNAQMTPKQVLAYKVKAQFDPDQTIPMLGDQGTAKIYGNHVIFVYYVFRRPLAWLRQTIGF